MELWNQSFNDIPANTPKRTRACFPTQYSILGLQNLKHLLNSSNDWHKNANFSRYIYLYSQAHLIFTRFQAFNIKKKTPPWSTLSVIFCSVNSQVLPMDKRRATKLTQISIKYISKVRPALCQDLYSKAQSTWSGQQSFLPQEAGTLFTGLPFPNAKNFHWQVAGSQNEHFSFNIFPIFISLCFVQFKVKSVVKW